MKKLIAIALVAVLLSTFLTTSATAEEGPKNFESTLVERLDGSGTYNDPLSKGEVWVQDGVAKIEIEGAAANAAYAIYVLKSVWPVDWNPVMDEEETQICLNTNDEGEGALEEVQLPSGKWIAIGLNRNDYPSGYKTQFYTGFVVAEP